MAREWDNDTRNPWNPKIHNILKTIDLHTKMHLETGNDFHKFKAGNRDVFSIAEECVNI